MPQALERCCVVARKPADQSVNREEIIMAAADVLRRNGYEATTMKDIAARVNLTAASLYHHFRNKDTLLLAVLEGGLDLVIDLIEPIVNADMPASEKLARMIEAHIVNVTQNTAVGAAMVFEIRSLMTIKSPPRNGNPFDSEAMQELIERRDEFFARRHYFEELFRRVVHEGIRNGEFRPVDVAIFTKTMLGAHNWVAVWFKSGGRLDGQAVANMMTDTFLRSLRP